MTNETLNAAPANNTDGSNTQQANESSATKAAPGTDANTQQQSTGGETQNNGGEQKPANDGKGGASQEKAGEEGTKEGEQKSEKKDDAKPAPKAPEKYEGFKLAEGVKIAPEVQTKFEAIARELDLPQEAAQKLLDLAPEINAMNTKALIGIANEQSDKWHEETRNDKELGGGGDEATYTSTMALVAKTRDAFATPELLSLLQRFDAKKNPNGTGLGNHPEVIRLFARIGSRLSEDNKFVGGNTTPPAQQAHAADKLYSNTTSKPK